MLKFGRICEVDAVNGLGKVHFTQENIVSDWLPFSVPISLDDQVQFPVHITQHVWCMMDDRCEDGVIGGAIYDTGNLPVDGDADIVRVKFVGGLSVEYNRNDKSLSIKGTGKIDIDVTGDVTVKCNKAVIDADTEIEAKALTKITLQAPIVEATAILKAASIQIAGGGTMTSDGDIITTGKVTASEVSEGAIRLGTHKHTGVTTGGGTSGTPVP